LTVVIAYIGLGSNLGDPAARLRSAVAALRQLPQSRYLADSGLYRSRALLPPGGEPQPDYCNAVAVLETELSAHALLDRLQRIEAQHGRTREQRWGARTLDLDLLLYGDALIDDARLSVPHPELHRREFVLHPLLRVAPELEIPGRGKLEYMAAQCPLNGLQYLGSIEQRQTSAGHEQHP
jgi:2-amino-4-hydroxy-6-hydroxymethyldihydropteridine diphosphokinase